MLAFVCNVILKVVNKFSGDKIPSDILDNYPKGAVSLVIDDLKWTFKPINWKQK